MGNAQSTAVHRKLSRELPPYGQMGHDANFNWIDKGKNVFTDEEDRRQFIEAVIAVITNNGVTNLEDHDFKLLYARREHDQERIIARIVAVKDGVIRAKLEPGADGVDQRDAFMKLKKDVEIKLDKILQAVPTSPSSAGPSSGPRAGATADAPPAYGSPAVGMGDRKKG